MTNDRRQEANRAGREGEPDPGLIRLCRDEMHVICSECSFLFCIFRFLTYDPKKRITADKALEHEYFNVSAFC